MTTRRFATSAVALALANAAACGSLSGNTGSPSTLVDIRGTVTSDSTSAPTSSLATAIVWVHPSQDGSVRETADSVPVSATFPASFNIALTSVPPASATIDLGAYSGDSSVAGVHIAFGFVVAYDDLNGNGRLDLVDASASQYVDAIEGVADQIIFYLDKPIPATFLATTGYLKMGFDGSLPQVGYNLIQQKPNYCFMDTDAGATGTCMTGVIWLPTDTVVTLPLGTPPSLFPQTEQELMCSTGPNADQSLVANCAASSCLPTISVTDFPGTLPSAADQNVLCEDLDNFRYTSSCTTSVAGVCQTVNTVCTQQTIVTLDPAGGSPIAPPAGWPCAAQPAPSAAFLSWLAGQKTTSSSGGSGPIDAGAGSD